LDSILFLNQIFQKDLVSLNSSQAEHLQYARALKQVSEAEVPSFYEKLFLYKSFNIKQNSYFLLA